MKISYISWLHNINYGGVENRAFNIAKKVNEQDDFHAELWCAGNSHTDKFEIFKKQQEGVNIKRIYLEKNPYQDPEKSKRDWERIFLKRLRDKLASKSFDLLDGQGINALPGIWLNRKSVAHIHGVDRWIADPPELEKELLDKATHLFPLTKKTHALLLSHGVEHKRMTQLYYGIDFARINDTEVSSKILENLDIKDKKIVIAIHNFSWQKNVRRTIEAFLESDLSSSHVFLIIGSGLEFDETQRYLNGNGVQNVILIGRKPPKEVFRYLKLADLYLQPSLTESWGITFVEAMAAGLPVIASDNCGVMEHFEHGRNIYSVKNPEDKNQIIEAINRINGDEKYAQKISAAGHAESKLFDETEIVNKYLSVVKSL